MSLATGVTDRLSVRTIGEPLTSSIGATEIHGLAFLKAFSELLSSARKGRREIEKSVFHTSPTLVRCTGYWCYDDHDNQLSINRVCACVYVQDTHGLGLRTLVLL
jgi:hypothetical protein